MQGETFSVTNLLESPLKNQMGLESCATSLMVLTKAGMSSESFARSIPGSLPRTGIEVKRTWVESCHRINKATIIVNTAS